MKKIWLLCLCLASLSLVGCFHVPDEDWLPSKDKTKSESIKKDEDVEQAINSIMQWIDTISSSWDQINYDEKEESYTGDLERINSEILDENINNDEIVDNEISNPENENLKI
jgi:hypothetical protein